MKYASCAPGRVCTAAHVAVPRSTAEASLSRVSSSPGLPHHRHINRRARHHLTPAGWCLIVCIGFWAAIVLTLRFG